MMTTTTPFQLLPRILSSILLFLLACSTARSTPGQPNVVVMLIDNHGFFELSCHGHPVLQTPRIDQFAAEGVSFSNFHAPPFCSPSRGALLTGRYALRAGIHNTVGGVSILHRDEKTVADFLKEAGYATGVFGKWHLGMNYPYAPKFRGFDEVFIHGGGGVSQLEDYYGNNHMDATYEHNGTYVKSDGFSTDVLFDQAIRFIKDQKGKPFFCYIATPAVHFPLLTHPENAKRLLARGVERSKEFPLYSMIENVDDNVGKLMDFLKAVGLRENTLVILASDQGVNDRGALVHRSGKWQNRGVQYDEKHQVYCMIQFPELTEGNAGPVDNLAGMVDLMPTVLDVCGIAQPDNLDGRSLTPLLSGSDRWDNERILIVQCPRKRQRHHWENVSIKSQQWRLVDGDKLYDVKEDRGQTVNLIERYPQIAKRLAAAYESFWKSLPPAEALISPHVLGSAKAPDVRLNGMDWYVGDAPWTQQILDRKTQNGKWRVEVARDGRFRFELRRYPREAEKPIEAFSAAIEIGPVKSERAVDPQAKQAVFELDLKRGTYDLSATFSHREGSGPQQVWGAYYAYVSYLD